MGVLEESFIRQLLSHSLFLCGSAWEFSHSKNKSTRQNGRNRVEFTLRVKTSGEIKFESVIFLKRITED